MKTNETHQHVLDVAESLFFQRGYNSVRLRDITDEIGIKHSALYYYAPGGKEDLFIQVMERSLQRHRDGMEQVIVEAGEDVLNQVRAVARWLISQPPMNISRLGESDFRAISQENALRLSALIFDALRLPLTNALEKASQAGVVDIRNTGLAAITFVSLVEMIHADNAAYMQNLKETIIEQLIDMLMRGWLKR